MKKIAFVFIFGLIINTTFGQDNPTADVIIEKYLTAIGGKDALNKIQDITISSTSETPRGVSETEIKFKMPNKYVMSTFANGMELFSVVCDGNKLVRKSSFGGGNQATKEGKEAQAEVMLMHPFAEMNYAAIGTKGEVQGIEKVDGKDAYKVLFTTAEAKTFTVWFDQASGLKLKTSSTTEGPRGRMESAVSYGEYKKFKGTEVMVPSSSKRGMGQMGEFVSDVQSVKINKGLKDSEFEIK
jgi:outer membrane lipoprotein-sorting protein